MVQRTTQRATQASLNLSDGMHAAVVEDLHGPRNQPIAFLIEGQDWTGVAGPLSDRYPRSADRVENPLFASATLPDSGNATEKDERPGNDPSPQNPIGGDPGIGK